MTGVPTKGTSWYFEIEAIIEDAVKIGAVREDLLDPEIRDALGGAGGGAR